MIAIKVFLGFCALLAAAAYIRAAYDDFGGREQMPALLVATVLALGFLGLLMK